MSRFDIITPTKSRFNISTPQTTVDAGAIGLPDNPPAAAPAPKVPGTLSGPTTLSQGKIPIVDKVTKFLDTAAKAAISGEFSPPSTYGESFDIWKQKRKDYLNSFTPKTTTGPDGKTIVDPESLQAASDAAVNFSPIGAVGSLGSKVTKGIIDKIAKSTVVSDIEKHLLEAGVDAAKAPTLAKTLTTIDKPKVIEDLIAGSKVPAKNTAESVNAAAEAAKIRPTQESTPLFQSTKTIPEQAAKTATILGRAEQEAADSAAQASKSGKTSSVESLPEILSKAPTPVKERVNALDYFRTPKYVLQKIGLGKEAETLAKAYSAYTKELPKNIDKITNWSKQVTDEGNQKIFNWLDGKGGELNPQEQKVAGEIKTWLNQWADRLGLGQNERVSSYITHIFPPGKGGEINEELAKIINKQIPGSVYDPYLLQRQGSEGFIQDTWKALDAYVKTATRKVHMDSALADVKGASQSLELSQQDYVKSYIDAINMRPTKLDTAIDNGIKSVVGYKFGVRPTKNLTASARRIVSRAKLGLSVTSAMKNITQGVNTFAELGTRYTTRGYIDLLKNGGKELEENGVLGQSFVEDRHYNAVKKFWEKADKAIWWNFEATEMLNRGAAYYGAKAKALAQGKTEEQAIEYGKEIAGKTQFQFGSIDSPVALSSDIVKTLAQFQTFTVKQIEFLGEKLKNKEYASVARYIGASSVVFGALGSAFGMSLWDVLPSLRFGVPPALDLPNRLFNDATGAKDDYGNVPSAKRRLKDAGQAVLTDTVPGGAQIDRTFSGLSAVNKGKSTTSDGDFQYRIPQTTENYARGALFGKSNLPEAKAYQEKKSGASKSKKIKVNRFNSY